MTEEALKPEQLNQAKLFLDQVDRRLASYDRRVGIMNSGLSGLIGVSAIAASLATSRVTSSTWVDVALAAVTAAAICGVVGLVPTYSDDLKLDLLREELLTLDEATATLRLADRRREAVRKDEPRIERKANLLRIGLLLLAVAIFLLLIGTFVR